jgi:hypothetical protein
VFFSVALIKHPVARSNYFFLFCEFMIPPAMVPPAMPRKKPVAMPGPAAAPAAAPARPP